MIKLYIDGTDQTNYLVRGSMRITEQLNNRSNVATFKIYEQEINHSTTVEVYKIVTLTEQAASGQKVITVDDTYEFYEEFRSGDELEIGIGGTVTYGTIDTIDHTTKEITMTENLPSTLPRGTLCGILIFAGTVESIPDREFGATGEFEYTVSATDRTRSLNKKNVARTYQDQYPREIVGRILYDYAAHDTEEVLETFETAWTHGGTGQAMSDETTDRIVGTNSQKTGTSGAGTATRTKAITAVDLTGKTDIRIWHKIAEGEGENVSSLTFRVGSSASDYYERSSVRVGNSHEDCRNRENFKIDRAEEIGTVDIANVDRLQIEVVTTAAVGNTKILFDQMIATSGGFTMKNAVRGDAKISDYRVPYKKPSEVIETITKRQSLFRFVDYKKDIHIFKQNKTPAPYNLTDTSENYGELTIEPDVTMLRNRQVVRGGEAPADSLFTQIHEADGVQTTRALAYKPKDLNIYIDTGAGYGTAQDVGLENLVDETNVDFVYNFQEKTLRNSSSFATLNAGDKIKITYYPYQSIRVQVTNPTSIATLKALQGGDGIVDGPVINDNSILTFEDARKRGQAELAAYANAIIHAKFFTNKGGLQAGQIITITDTDRGIDDDFLIQKVNRRLLHNAESEYQIECGSTMFGLIEFFQLLLKKTSDLVINDSEIVDIVINQDETVTMTDALTATQKSKSFDVAEIMTTKRLDFVGNDGTKTSTGVIVSTNQNKDRYAKFSSGAVGTVGFDAASNHNTGTSLYIDLSSAGAGEYALARMTNPVKVKPSTEYDVAAWIANLASGGISGGNGVDVTIQERFSNQYGYKKNDINRGSITGRYDATPTGNVTIGNDANGEHILFDGDRDHTAATGTKATAQIGTQPTFTQADDFTFSVKFIAGNRPANNRGGIFGSLSDFGLGMFYSSDNIRLVSKPTYSIYQISYTVGQLVTITVAYEASSGKAYVYKDGVIQNPGGTTMSTTFTTNDWYLGDNGGETGNASSIQTKIYYARIRDRLLDASEALDEYQHDSDLAKNYDGLVAAYTPRLYAGTAGSPTTIYDSKMFNAYNLMLAETTLVSGFSTVQDFKKEILEGLTTTEITNYLNVEIKMDESTGKVSVSDILIQEQATPTQSNPAAVSFSELTT